MKNSKWNRVFMGSFDYSATEVIMLKMRLYSWRLFRIAPLLWILGGCAHHARVEKPIRALVVADLLRDQSVRRGYLESFSAKLKMGYESPKQNVSGKGRLVGKYPQLFRLELRDPLGRLHYVLIQNGASVTAHYPRNQQAVKESASGKKYFERILGAPVSFDEIVALAAGVLPTKWEKAPVLNWGWDKEAGAYRAEFVLAKERLTVWVDSANTAIQSLRLETPNGPVTAEYQDREPCCDTKTAFYLGYEVRIRLDRQESSVNVTWDALGKPTQDFAASVFEFVPADKDKVIEIH